MISIILGVIGLLLEIFGVYYLSRGLFINGIRRVYYYGVREIRKFPFGLRLACKILRISKQNIEDIISEGIVPYWPELTPEVKKLAYEPFYGFLLLLAGLGFQIVAMIFR